MSSLYNASPLRGSTGSGLGMKTPRGYDRVDNYTPEQMQIFQQMFSNLSPGSFLSRLAGGDQDIFNQIEAPALQQFSGLQGGLASKFSGMGSGARRSSGFQNTLNQASSDFASQLQSQRQGLQQQALQDLMNMSNNLLQQSPYSLIPKKKSFLQELLSSLGGGIGSGIGSFGGMAGMNYFNRLMG